MALRLPRPADPVYLRLEFPRDKHADFDRMASECGNLSGAAFARVVLELLTDHDQVTKKQIIEEVERRRAQMATQQPKPEPKKRGRPKKKT